MATGSRYTALALVAALLTLVPAAPTTGAPAGIRAEVRVNQQGWLRHETKLATLMASAPIGHTTFTVVRDGKVVLRGTVPARPVGGWSGRFPAVYRLDLSALHPRGPLGRRTRGAVRLLFPPVPVAGGAGVYAPLVGL